MKSYRIWWKHVSDDFKDTNHKNKPKCQFTAESLCTRCQQICFFSKSKIKSAKLANQIQILTKWFVSNIRDRKYSSLVICATALIIFVQISLTTVCKSFLCLSMVECPSVVNPIHPFLKMPWVKQCINKLDKRQAFLYDTRLRAPTLLRSIVAPCY